MAWSGQEWPVPVCVGGGTAQGRRRYAQLSEIAGENAAKRIVAQYGGGMLIVPNLKEVRHQRDQDLIRAEFDRLTLRNGYSSRDAVFELGVKYGYAGRTIEKIIKRPDAELVDVVQGVLSSNWTAAIYKGSVTRVRLRIWFPNLLLNT